MTAVRLLVLLLAAFASALRAADAPPPAPAVLLPGPTLEHPDDAPDHERASNARFGEAVAVDGNYAVVGASRTDGPAGEDQGVAYVYASAGPSWDLVATLLPDDAEPYTLFGSSVAIAGDTILVGSRWDTVDGRQRAGSVYVFARDGAGWKQVQKLVPPGTLPGLHFGASVAISGNRAAVGAFLGQSNGVVTGVVYPYVRDGAAWVAEPPIAPTSNQAVQYFGYSVALAGDLLLVGSPLHQGFGGEPSVGRAELFRHDGAGWTSAGDVPGLGGPHDWFGASVALTGEYAAIAAPYADGQNMDAGRVMTLDVRSGFPSPTGFLQAVPAQSGTWFGFGLAFAGRSLFVGQPGSLGPAQRVFRYGYAEPAWTLRETVTSPSQFGAFGWSIGANVRSVLGGAPDAFVQQTGHQVGRVFVFERLVTVMTESTAGGRVLPAGPVLRPAGDPAAFGAMPDAGWRVASLAGCGGVVSGATLFVASLADDCTVSATFANDAPAITQVAASDTTVDEGATVTLSISATDDNDTAEQLRYAFDCDGDGTDELAPQASSQTDCTYASPGTFEAKARVVDRAGASRTGTVSIAVAEIGPAVTTFNAPATAVEDTLVEVALDFSVPPGRTFARFEVDCDYVVGTFDVDRTLLGTGVSVCPPYTTGGTKTIAVRAIDSTGDVSPVRTRTIDIESINDAPTFALPGELNLGPGGVGTYERPGFATDVVLGPADEASQTVVGYTVAELDDLSNIVSAAAIDASGKLTLTLTGEGGYAVLGVTLTDSGGTPGSPASEQKQVFVLNDFGTDLRVAVDDGTTKVLPGAPVTYSIVLRNAGPNAGLQSRLQVPVPAGLDNVSWGCVTFDAVCSFFGTGAIDVQVDLAVGAVVTLELSGTVAAAPDAFVTTTATVTPRDGVGEAAPGDNMASDVDAVVPLGLFTDDFEAGAQSMQALWR